MKNILEFLRGITGQLSSKRLAFLSALPVCYCGTLGLVDKLISINRPELAVHVWDSFFILVTIFGGFVSAELLPAIFKNLTGKIKSKSKE